MEYISLAYTQCMSWCTPILPESNYVFLFVVKQLRPSVWVALLLSIVLVSFSAVILSNVAFEPWTANNSFSLALSIYGSPQPIQPRTSSIRVLVFMWLFTCLVLRAAYEGEMKVRFFIKLQQKTPTPLGKSLL